MRFQKRTKILGDLVRLNFSGGGVSLSLGVPGARINIPILGQRKASYTISAPGTGISHTSKLPNQ